MLARTGSLSPRTLYDLNRQAYWVRLLSVLVYRIAGASPDTGSVCGLLVAGFGATFIVTPAAVGMARMQSMPESFRGTFVLC